jgi:ADP-ribosyl-[dinitrogen reductase] hydrolase
VVVADERHRARGALVGLACGDAVGTTVEFRAPGTFRRVEDMVGGGPFRLAAGEWTDDTSMALCLAESIVDRGGLDLADNLRRYLLWRDEGYLSSNGRCFDIGSTVSAQLGRFGQTGEAIDPPVDQEAAANGSLMRLAPVPVAWHRDLARAVERSGESSRSTHPAQRPVDACRFLGAVVAALVSGAPWEAVSAPDFWVWGELHPEVAAVAAGSYRDREPPAIRGDGYCVRSLEAALWAVAGAADVAGAVLRAVNLGEDADTTAAIAGQIAGARWGIDAIPGPWVRKLVHVDRIVSLADGLFDLEADGGAGAAGWLHDGPAHAWWVEPGRVLAGEYPGPWRGDSTKLDILIDAGVRTFVDLTTSADPLDPYEGALAERARLRDLDLRYRRFPIPDFGTIDLPGYASIVELIRAEVAEGRAVYVHCWGGIGRTGTVVGCLLADAGIGAEAIGDRLAHLRAGTGKADRHCPETADQRAVIERRVAGRNAP